MKEKFIRKFCIKTWKIWEYFGVHLIPNHFYWPISESCKLENYNFDSVFPMDGISFDIQAMNKLILDFGKYSYEYSLIHHECGYCSNGDGHILYAMLRKYRPQRLIEVGSGFSTVIIDEAFRRNHEENGDVERSHITSIEPYPKLVLKTLVSNSNNITLIENRVEEVDKALFQQLDYGDILFIDSSHVVDISNDVHFLYLHILPQIPIGVIIHIHDIRFPYEYPKGWVLDAKKHWGEQYLLHMFLAFNDSFEVILASNYVYRNNRAFMANNLIGLDKDHGGWPGSFWIRRIK